MDALKMTDANQKDIVHMLKTAVSDMSQNVIEVRKIKRTQRFHSNSTFVSV